MRSVQSALGALLLTGLVSLACRPSPPEKPPADAPPVGPNPSGGALIRTQRDEYRPVVMPDEIAITIVATFTNSTRDTLTLHPCTQHPPYALDVQLQRLEGNEWRTAVPAICTLALMLKPPVLPPGRARTDTLRIAGSRRPNTVPAFAPGPLAGTYRLHYGSVYRTWTPNNTSPNPAHPLGEPLADSLRVSNIFRIVD